MLGLKVCSPPPPHENSPLISSSHNQIKHGLNRLDTEFPLKKLCIFSVLSSSIFLTANSLAATWKNVDNTDFLQYDADSYSYRWSIDVNSHSIDLFKYAYSDPGNPLPLNLKLTQSNKDSEFYLNFGTVQSDPLNKEYKVDVDLQGYKLSLGGKSSIAAFDTGKRANNLIKKLNIIGNGSSVLELTGSEFGMKLGGRVNLNLSGMDEILIIGPEQDQKPSGSGITVVSGANWNHDQGQASNVIISNSNLLKVKGNINHALSSYGDNKLSISTNRIEISTDVTGIYSDNVKFNSIVTGDGIIELDSKESLSLKGTSASEEDIFNESYVIRGAQTVCTACGKTPVARYWNADFTLNSNTLIEIDSNWGAVFMESATDGGNTTYYAKTSISAPEVKIVAAGSSSDDKTHATFKAISKNGKEASISLEGTGDNGSIQVDAYSENAVKQDFFYASGKNASISLNAKNISINNNFGGNVNSKADVRSLFFADDSSSITVEGELIAYGHTLAKNGGSINLGLETGSVYTGAVVDLSYDSIANHEYPNGKVTMEGRGGAEWNVRPFDDTPSRGTIFSGVVPLRFDSTIDTLKARDATQSNPFNVNLTAAALTRGPMTFTPQNLKVAHLTDSGFINFALGFDDKSGTASGAVDGRDTVTIYDGKGLHGIYVNYLGAHDSDEPESLRNRWLAVDDSEKAQFVLTNEGGKVDIGLYQYTLASDSAASPLGESEGQAKYWYLKRASSRPTDPDDPDQPDTPLTPGADSNLSFAGSHRYLHWTDLQDLRKRLGEVRYGSQDGAWARVIAQKDLADGQNGASGLKQTYQGLNIGLDRLVSVAEEKMWLLGANFNFGQAEQKTRGNDHGKGETDRYGLNLYATWADNTGSYADFVGSFDYYEQEINTHANNVAQKGEYDTFGFGASVEVGKQFTFESDDYTWGPWYRHTWVEPQLQLAYYWLKGKKYKLSNHGIRVNIKDDDSLIGRAGIVIGSKWNYGENYNALNKKYFQIYGKAGVKHDFMGDYKVTMNDQMFSKNIGATTFYYGAGLDWQAGDDTRLYVQFEREEGDNYTKDYEVSAGLKYQF